VELFESLKTKVPDLVETVKTKPMYWSGDEPSMFGLNVFLTTYTPFIIFIILLVLVVVFAAKRQLSLVPKNRFVGFMEFFVNFTKTEVAEGVMGNAARKHMPFLLTVFVFILFSNLVGIIPGLRPATGTLGTTLVLTVISFIYFTVYGIKQRGGFHYLISFAPKGLKPLPLAAFIWLLEFFSMVLRLLTLSVRLFANMFAGHLLLGVLAIMTALFFQPMINLMTGASSFNPGDLGALGVSIVWQALLAVMYALELFVALVQAFVFTLLSSVYVFLATEEH
jgi:F-type H+-transporting ATPase subunit a